MEEGSIQTPLTHQLVSAIKNAHLQPTSAPQVKYVYAMQSAAFPDTLKIGRSNNVKNRLKSSNTFCKPAPFQVVASMQSMDNVRDEKLIHSKFAAKHVKGEFFLVSTEEVIQTFLSFEAGFEKEKEEMMSRWKESELEKLHKRKLEEDKEKALEQQYKKQRANHQEQRTLLISKLRSYGIDSTGDLVQAANELVGVLEKRIENIKKYIDLVNENAELQQRVTRLHQHNIQVGLEKQYAAATSSLAIDSREKLLHTSTMHNALIHLNVNTDAQAGVEHKPIGWTISMVATKMGIKPDLTFWKSAGIYASALYKEKTGQKPTKHFQHVDGAIRPVNSYDKEHLDVVENGIKMAYKDFYKTYVLFVLMIFCVIFNDF
jgi:hypothetical protein